MDDGDVAEDAPRPDRRCPECGAPALPVLWGLRSYYPGPGVILGGCVIVGDPAPWGCRECGWRGELTAAVEERS